VPFSKKKTPVKKRDRDYRRDPSPITDRSNHQSPNRKKEKQSPSNSKASYYGSQTSSKDAPKGSDQPICNGCGRRLTDNHTEDNCWFIKDRLEGWNEEYKTTPWLKSKAAQRLRDMGKPENMLFLSITKEGESKTCCTLSNPNLNPLPFISCVILPAQQESQHREEEEEAASISRESLTRKDRDSAQIFLDTGSGDDFISDSFAESVINLYGYKPIINSDNCFVCTAYGKECSPCGNKFKLNLLITDDNGQQSILPVMVKTLPIKHKIIIGLNTIKQNNLLWRYPSLFLNESFSGYLQGNLLWRYLNEMFTEHMRGTGAVFPQSFEGKKRRIEPPRLEPECSNPSVELVGSTNPPRERE
jgi:hypothetical protein